jgi:urease accessory protein
LLLELLQLADSALPIGGTAHSFGLETLVEDSVLTPETLAAFLVDHLSEAAVLEAVYLRRAARLEDWNAISAELSARRPARESREASLKIGARFIDLFNALTNASLPRSLHYCIAFGAAGATLQIPEATLAAAYLQQSMTGLISACQRLMPLGQVAASRMLWDLRPAITRAVDFSEQLDISCFNPLPELGSMRHPMLETRLFIS